MKLLLDTNVLFSGLGSRSVVGRLLEELVHQRHTLVTSEYILEELRRKIRAKFHGPQKEVALDLLLFMLGRIPLEVKEEQEYRKNFPRALECVPEQDAPILALALLEDIDYLVTGDKAHFLENQRVKALLGARLKSPRALLTLLEEE